MYKFGKLIVKAKVPILIIGILLLIPSFIGITKTRVNYDILSYLPDTIDTMKGQDVMLKEFGKGGFSFVILEGMDDKEVAALKTKIEKVDHVSDVLWYDSIADLSLPKEVLPNKIYDFFNADNSTMMCVFFDESTSADVTLDAVTEIKKVCGKQCFVNGTSAIVNDIKDLTIQETTMYVIVAALLTSIVLAVTMDSFLIPVFFMLSVGMAIIYNLGSNVILGEISFITKALTAVLQLGVTIDYSIFLWHSYKEQQQNYPDDNHEAMAVAISKTISSVVGSSITTVAGFLALCFMTYALGLDLGLVMAKGVVLGVISCITILPSMILIFDKALTKTMHRDIIPKIDKIAAFIIKRHIPILVVFIIILIPSIYGYYNTKVYYTLTDSIPQDLNSVVANSKLEKQYHMASTHMIICDAKMSSKDVNSMLDEMDKQSGVSFSLSLNTIVGPLIPEEVIPDSVKSILKSDKYQMMLIGSNYKNASDDCNKQITNLQKILKKYDSKGMLIGEAAATKDLISITNRDFQVVNVISIAAIFIIIFLVLRSVSLPIILVLVIESAITINMALPFYLNTTIPFIASIVIGTIQLGATVDYAILMTTRYKTERVEGKDKNEAVTIALSTSMKSIIVSALGFFAATFGVGLCSSVDMISQLCTLMSRGAIISMFTVILILPSLLLMLDKAIIHSTLGMKDCRKVKITSLHSNNDKLYKLPEIK